MNLASMALGALLVVIGVLSGALADRIRGAKIERRASRSRSPTDTWTTEAHERMRKDVIAALVKSGYPRSQSMDATNACQGAEQSTLDAWLRAALKKLHAAS